MQVDVLFFLIILIFSVIIHEVAHGFVAEMLGDPTARLAGRLTLNPRPHIDPVGSILVPGLLMLGSGNTFSFGWAKPVPYNPHNLRNFKWGSIAVALAGVTVNLIIAIIFGLIVRFYTELGLTSVDFYNMMRLITELNIILAVFNLIPFPPLDGSKVLFNLLPHRYMYVHDYLEHNWLLFIVFILMFAHYIIAPISGFLSFLITGIH